MKGHIQRVAQKVRGAGVKFSPLAKEMLERISALDFDVPETMNATNAAEAKLEFLSDPFIRQPNFVFGKIAEKASRESFRDFLQLMSYFQETWIPESKSLPEAERSLVSHLYIALFEKYCFMWMTATYNAAETIDEELAKTFYEFQAGLFAPPQQADFRRTLTAEVTKVCEKMSRFSSGDFKKVEELEQELGELLGLSNSELNAAEKQADSARTILGRYQKLLQNYFGPMLATVPAQAKNRTDFSAEEVCEWLNNILGELVDSETGAPITKFRATISDEVTNFSVNQQERLIKIPRKRATGNYSCGDFLALIVGHELGTHILRGVPFEGCDLEMLSTGLPGYLDFEEGVACCTEMALRGKMRDVGYAHYTNVGLAYFEQKDFREVFEIRSRLNYLSGVTLGETEESKQRRWEKSRNTAYAQTARCFRGTGNLVNFKDLTYYNGTEKALKFISEHLEEPEELMRWLFWSGKIDPTDETHRQLVEYVLS